MDITGQFSFLIVFILLSAFFSGVEAAFISLSGIRLQHLMDQKKRGIKKVKALTDDREKLIITILIGNNLANIAASSLATSITLKMFPSHALGIAVGIMTLLILIFGEIVPKNIAIAKNEQIALISAPLISLLQIVLYPLIKILVFLTRLISKPFGGVGIGNNIITEDEIKTVVRLGEKAGEVEEDERIMIHNIFRFSDLQAAQIMVDRTRMFSIDLETDIPDIIRSIVKKGLSRIPVYENTPDNIVGILYAKDVLKASLSEYHDRQVKDLVRPPMFIPETMLLDDLLKLFQKEKVHIALVADEHGGISGLITIEDLLEEIVGDIYDETDKEQIMIRKINETKSLVKGDTEIEEVNSALDLNLNEKDDYETISGFILARMRRIPKTGEELRIQGALIRITDADKKQILEVEIQKEEPESSPDENKENS